jgi:prolyl oligopeptidase
MAAANKRSKSGAAGGEYPHSRRGDHVDYYHGEAIGDPYRWLEDGTDPQTVSWVAAQNRLTQGWLAGVPARDEIRSRITRWSDYPRFGVPLERGGRWFATRNTGLQSQPVLHVMDAPDAAGHVLIDPNALSADGTVAVAAVSVSPDGEKVAYATAASGSDWLTWRVRDVASAADLGDTLASSKSPNAEWRQDSSGFYYTCYTAAGPGPAPGRGSRDAAGGHRDTARKQVRFHRLSTAQQDDELVYDPPDAALFSEITLAADGRYLVLSLGRGIGPGAELRVLDLDREDAAWQELLPAGDTAACVVAAAAAPPAAAGEPAAAGATFYVVTDDAADKRRIVAIDLDRPGRPHWREVVGEAQDTLLEAHFFGGRLVCHYLRDACSLLRVFSLDGTFVRDIPLPPMCTLAGSQVAHELIEGTPGSDIVHFEVVSFTESARLYRHDLRSGQTTLVRPAAAALGRGEFIAERVLVTSADGTRVPMFLTRRRDLPQDGEAPVLLYGYGGVGASETPRFSPAWAAWLERGGMLAVASLRGGGEFGRAWHDAGKRASKQNVFDDFCACARWLASSGWSRAARIAINGGSNGGLLVGACLTQHPELFGAAIADVGLFDMLRYPNFTVAWLWKTEYGDPDDPEQYRWLRRYSPLHHVRPGTYPPTLLTTGDHDDRVVPAHSFKFTAALQEAQQAAAPILLRVDISAGHGGGKPTAKAIAEAADRLAFAERALDMAPLHSK